MDQTFILAPFKRGCISTYTCDDASDMKLVDGHCECKFPDMLFDETLTKCINKKEDCLPDVLIDHCLFADEQKTETCDRNAQCNEKLEKTCDKSFDCTQALFSGKESQVCNVCHRSLVRDPTTNTCITQRECKDKNWNREKYYDSQNRFREFVCVEPPITPPALPVHICTAVETYLYVADVSEPSGFLGTCETPTIDNCTAQINAGNCTKCAPGYQYDPNGVAPCMNCQPCVIQASL